LKISNYNTKNYIIFYKGYVLTEIVKRLNTFDYFSRDEVDNALKHHAGIEKSCKEMDYFDINELIIWSFQFGDKIGLNLNFKDD
jgi:hypothetical protein